VGGGLRRSARRANEITSNTDLFYLILFLFTKAAMLTCQVPLDHVLAMAHSAQQLLR
jgi:hypothetical protein